MPVKAAPIGALRRRLPRLSRQVLAQLPKLPIRTAGERLRGIGWRTIAGAVLLGGIVHICATFAAPLFTSGHAYRLLADKLPVNRMLVLPLQAPGRQLLPYLPPDMLYAMCRYDLRAGPLAVSAPVLDAGWALSLHTPHGSNFYVLPGLPQRRTDVSFVLVPSGPDAHLLPRGTTAAETQIASPGMEGLIVLRAPLRGLAWFAETDAVLQGAICAPVKQ
jgi:uncharacterized membrane protein